jgi:predicted MFS family arabinose efflux permease
MPALLTDRKIVGALLVLAITQIIGWGTVGLPAVVGRQMAADLDMTIAAVFAGTSVLYVTMGLSSPFLVRLLVRHGARLVMTVGALLAVPGFSLLAFAHGSATLATSAYVMLNEVAGPSAKRAIGALMLVTGLSSSVFWPVTAFISGMIGWRGAALTYAALMIVVCCPLYFFGLPRREVRAERAVPQSEPAPTVQKAPNEAGTFGMVTAVIALNAFVAFGLSAVFLELLKASGMPEREAIVYGSSLGVIQISARAVDFIGGARWDGITTALVAGSLLPISFLVLVTGGGAHWSILVFILLYGLGSGALAVARATIPMVFYDSVAFTRATARIALPLNLMSALAPPLLAGLLVHSGRMAMIGVVFVCSCLGLWLLVMLRQRRPKRTSP